MLGSKSSTWISTVLRLALLLARIIEPTSKLAAIGVFEEIGVPAPYLNTFAAALKRCIARDYRNTLATACLAHSASTAAGRLSLVLYDCTTLWFEVDDEDELRKAGMSKQRRVDLQIQVGLLVDPSGFPLQVHCFEDNKAETKTLIPVLEAFQQRHGVTDMVVVTDAGMLSAGNLNALEDAGLGFIVADRIRKVPYEIDGYIDRHGDYFTDGQTFETTRTMGTGANLRKRQVIYQYRRARERLDLHNINKQIAKAEKMITGDRPVKKDRFVRFTSKAMVLDQALIERARQLAGLKGYVTNLTGLPAATIIAAYHDLFEVERSFRMSKHDLAARPIYHRKLESIEAHLMIVFTALAVSRYLHNQTRISIKKIVRTLRPLRTVQINVGGHAVTAAPKITSDPRHTRPTTTDQHGGALNLCKSGDTTLSSKRYVRNLETPSNNSGRSEGGATNLSILLTPVNTSIPTNCPRLSPKSKKIIINAEKLLPSLGLF